MEAKFGNRYNKNNSFTLFSHAKFVAKVAKFGITINVSILYDSKVNNRIRSWENVSNVSIYSNLKTSTAKKL